MMSSLYIGATGLKTQSEGMSVITNNLANASTVGYKRARINYQDLMSQYLTSQSTGITNVSQAGMGAMVGSVGTIFTESGYEKGSASTDLSISGKGFFGVASDGQVQYTRAGNFRFTAAGDLVDPNGWQLLGYAITDGARASTATPIALNLSADGIGHMPGQGATKLTAYSQLGGLEDMSENAASPFFAMASNYNGTESPPLSAAQYSYAEPITIHDANGVARQATIYYDLAGQSNGNRAFEYIVAIDPSEDASGLAGTASAGLLMAGTVSFSSSGQMQNMTAFTPGGADPADLNSWTAASLDASGHALLNLTYTKSEAQTVGLNLGLSLTGSASAGFATAADMAAGDASTVYGAATGAKRDPTASTSAGTSAGSIMQQTDGYGAGSLYNVYINADGVMYGAYSNGKSQDLYQIPLYNFTSEDGLRREGGNRFSATIESGEVIEGVAGTVNFGLINEASLEQSNVDYTTEFTNMIITQRGFQMNSKVITTSDTMLQKALEIKR